MKEVISLEELTKIENDLVRYMEKFDTDTMTVQLLSGVYVTFEINKKWNIDVTKKPSSNGSVSLIEYARKDPDYSETIKLMLS